MRRSYSEIIHYESGWRLQSMLRRIGQVRQLFPWLRPGQSHAELRRTVARLRSGALPSIDSRIPAAYLADLLEGSIEQDLLVREIRADMQSYRELSEKLRKRSR